MRTFFLLACLAVAYGTEKNREGRLFLVSHSTTTTTLKTSTFCYNSGTTTITTTCTGRKKRTIVDSPLDNVEVAEFTPVESESEDVKSSQLDDNGKPVSRERKFLLYWMTSTSTTTTTSYTTTISIASVECTPSPTVHALCGR